VVFLTQKQVGIEKEKTLQNVNFVGFILLVSPFGFTAERKLREMNQVAFIPIYQHFNITENLTVTIKSLNFHLFGQPMTSHCHAIISRQIYIIICKSTNTD
jgi:hypothetical protein